MTTNGFTYRVEFRGTLIDKDLESAKKELTRKYGTHGYKLIEIAPINKEPKK